MSRDKLTPERRSWNMSRIKSRNTKPELTVRSILHRMGFRFRLHGSKLPGKPDIVLSRHRAVIFVHGCFWHRHEGCKQATTPGNNREFWVKKFESNVTRDQINQIRLQELGWRVLVIWGCTVDKGPRAVAEQIESFLGAVRPYRLPIAQEQMVAEIRGQKPETRRESG